VRSLSPDVLASLPPSVAVPGYDRTAVSAGIVHLGVGGFHRAHQAVYLDALLAAGESPGLGACAASGVLAARPAAARGAARQDGLFTSGRQAPDGSRTARVVGSLLEHLLAPDDPGAVVERLADPATRISHADVTEGGYQLPAELPARAAGGLPRELLQAGDRRPRAAAAARAAAR
jgi:mannitol 2-dehydrogenase